MNKNLILAATLSGFCAQAGAQSSVTLFGVVDANVRYVKNGDVNITQQSADGINSSRLGFRGIEDLGGWLKASLWLEHGFQPDTGTQTSGAKFWNRRSTVSLSGAFGEMRLGRDYAPTFWNLALFDPFNALGIGSSVNVIAPGPQVNVLGTGALTAIRADNAVGYFLPAPLGGVYGQAMVAAGEGNGAGKYAGGRIGYAAGALDVAVAVARTYTVPDELEMVNAGASYNFGTVKLMGLVNQSKAAARKQFNWQLGAVVTVGLGELRLAYNAANATGGGTDANDAKQLALGGTYNLSKRTALYFNAAQIKNDGAANFTVALPPGAVAGAKSSAYELGVRHFF